MERENRLKTKAESFSGGQRQALALLTGALVPPKLPAFGEYAARPVTAKKVFALAMGGRAVMTHKGNIVTDIREKKRETMSAESLLERYKNTVRHEPGTDTISFKE